MRWSMFSFFVVVFSHTVSVCDAFVWVWRGKGFQWRVGILFCYFTSSASSTVAFEFVAFYLFCVRAICSSCYFVPKNLVWHINSNMQTHTHEHTEARRIWRTETERKPCWIASVCCDNIVPYLMCMRRWRQQQPASVPAPVPLQKG